MTEIPDPDQRRRKILAMLLMLAAIAAVYFRPATIFGDQKLWGADYAYLHEARIRFAREAIFSAHPMLPGWYPREAMGTPFSANIQNFPWVPTRLAILLFDPATAYAIGILLAAGLSGIFTFCFCRRLGMNELACAAAGFTFAASGYFAARVFTGHLPLLEAYPALPMLLLLVEKCLHSNRRRWPVILGLCTCCVALCGHPQVPIYAMAIAGVYVIWRERSWRAVRILMAMGFGACAAAFALVPMWMLIGRSSRLLALAPADNDINFPYRRLLAFVLPWHDGWPTQLAASPRVLPYPNDAYFWDTVCYVGLLPLIAVTFLACRAAFHRRISKSAIFFTVAGALALVTALPFISNPGGGHELLRSSSRQIYVTIFALSLGLGAFVDFVMRNISNSREWLGALLAVALMGHAVDLSFHDHSFITANPRPAEKSDAEISAARDQLGEQRVAYDFNLPLLDFNRELDDAGFFDSIVLARTYQVLLDFTHKPPDANIEFLLSSDFDTRALRFFGVTEAKTLATTRRDDGSTKYFVQTTDVDHPAPRARFFALQSVQYLNDAAIHANLRTPSFDPTRWLMLPAEAASTSSTDSANASGEVDYVRDSSDEMTINVTASSLGFLGIVESYDPGWHASINGNRATILPADGAFMAIAVPPGKSEVKLRYSSPGAKAGAWISVASLIALLAVAFIQRPRNIPPV